MHKNSNATRSVAVIGGGIGGLVVALKLIQEGYKVTIIEKQNFVGGIATSFHHGDYIMDVGPHVLTFPTKSEITDEIISIVEEENLIDLPSISNLYKTYFQGSFFTPATPISKIFTTLGIGFSFRAFGSYFISKCKNLFKSKFHTIDEYMIASYGEFLYNIWFKNYIKLQFTGSDYSLKNIVNSYPGLSLKSIILIIFTKKSHVALTDNISKIRSSQYNKYPKLGMLFLIQKIQDRITDKGGKIFLNSTITSITHNSPKKITFEQNNQKNELNIDAIIYALPPKLAIQWFPNPLQPSPPKNLAQNAIMVFLFVDSPGLFDWWVINFNQPDLIFFRISQQNFLSKNICPKNKTLLCIEIMCNDNDEISKYEDSKLLSIVLSDLKKIDILNNETIDSKILKFNNLYIDSQMSSNPQQQEIYNFINSHKQEYLMGVLQDSGNSSDSNPSQSNAGFHSAFLNAAEIVKKINLDFTKK